MMWAGKRGIAGCVFGVFSLSTSSVPGVGGKEAVVSSSSPPTVLIQGDGSSSYRAPLSPPPTVFVWYLPVHSAKIGGGGGDE